MGFLKPAVPNTLLGSIWRLDLAHARSSRMSNMEEMTEVGAAFPSRFN